MPTLRSSKRLNSEKESSVNTSSLSQTTKEKTMTANTETHQWVMIGPDDVFNEEESSGQNDILLCKLPHPQNNEVTSLFGFKKNKVYELMKFEEKHRSWFVDETVQKDGSLYMVTPIDPLLLVLPYVEKAASLSQFTTLDNILTNEEHKNGLQLLEKCVDMEMIQVICDCKGSDDLIVFKSNEEKILRWLSRKVTKLSNFLMNSNINIEQGAQVSNFVKSSDSAKSKDDCVRYAWSMVSDYITEHWSLKLKEKFDIKDIVKPVIPPPAKRQKLNSEEEQPCLEDYRDKNSDKTSKKSIAATKKISTAQKKLNKVNKSGMKTMGNFFKTAPKK